MNKRSLQVAGCAALNAVVLFVLLNHSAYTQVAPRYCTISGTVQTPSSSGLARRTDSLYIMPLPVPVCTVTAMVSYQTLQSKVMAVTDAAGHYAIDSLEALGGPRDTVIVVTRKSGYAESRKTIVLTGRDSVCADFSLIKTATGIERGTIARIGKRSGTSVSTYSLDGRHLEGRISGENRSGLHAMNATDCVAIMRSVKNGIPENRIVNLSGRR